MRQPFYRNIAHRIETGIAVGDYASGMSFPSKTRLEREFRESRIPIRQALGFLKRCGILYARSGAGAHVRAAISEPASIHMSENSSGGNTWKP